MIDDNLICTVICNLTEELLLLWSSFFGCWLFLWCGFLFRCSLLGLGLLHLFHFLGRLLLWLLSFLGLLWFLRQFDGTVDSSGRLSAAGNQCFGCQHLLDSPPHVALDLL